ncbi:MAG: transporter [Actinomycetia bacterium]|jgi:D-xylose transport system ATP-binding protein|nr:transporter [Actinomycetes bacterium]MDQ1652774.1 D-xylose transport system ATP-binding protein [Cryptosporangiaceae bacterium]MDQ1658060.1 D-xylose transport system ATP-binding protein [Cryptosporangiaceae bacterium]
MTTIPALELRGVDKSFGPVRALSSVNLTARAGEVTALVGDNGAGKSTLIKCIGGIHRVDAGELVFDGSPRTLTGPRDAAQFGVAIVYQDLALCDNLDITDNMFLGREEVTRRGTLDVNTMEKQARRALDALSVRTVRSVHQVVANLSGGQRQTVAIAKAVLWKAKIVVLDEPTAALGVVQTEQVLDLVRRLADQGVAVILVSHNMNDVMRVADSIGVLYLGRMAAQVKRVDVTQTQIVELITTGRSGDLGLSSAESAGVAT